MILCAALVALLIHNERRELIGLGELVQKAFYKGSFYQIGRFIYVLLITLLTLSIFTSCKQAEETPVGEVSMIGIDYHNKEYQVTLQLVNHSNTHLQKPNYYQGNGQTVAAALKVAELKYGNKLIWDTLKVVVIGKQAAVQSADGSVLDLGAKVQIDPNTLVTVAEPSAERLVKGEQNAKGIDASKVEMRLLEGMRKQLTPQSRVASTLKAAEAKSSGSMVSYVVANLQRDSDMTLEIAGSGVFYQNTLFALLDPPLTEAVLNIKDKPRQMDMHMVGNKFDLLSGVIKKSKVKLVPVMNDGKLSFIVSLSCDGGSINISGGDTKLKDKSIKEKFSLTMQGTVGDKGANDLKLPDRTF